MEQEELKRRENQELMKEGRAVPQEEKKKNVRRDLFEPSSDNPAFKGEKANIPQQNPWQKATEIETKDSVFGNQPSSFRQGIDLPINNRKEDLFGPGLNYQIEQNQEFKGFSNALPIT